MLEVVIMLFFLFGFILSGDINWAIVSGLFAIAYNIGNLKER